jgi:uncharacterized phage protein gp47/JayE
MANIVKEKAADILRRSITQLSENTQITRFTPGSKARTVLGIMSEEIERLEEVLSANLVLGLVQGATGDYLDFLGDITGVPRQQPSTASVSAVEQLIQITPPNGLSFGDLNSQNQIVIPAGTFILSSDSEIRYTTTTQLVLPSNGVVAYTGARAALAGTSYNVGPGVLTQLQFTNYTSYPTRQLAVTNLSAIESGADVEEDDVYRYRIQNGVLSAEAGNATAIRLAALSVPSTADVTILNLYRGIGTADVVVDTDSGELAIPTLNRVRSAVQNVASAGVSIVVRPPILIGLEVTTSLRLVRGLSLRDELEVKRAVYAAVQNVVADVSLGGILRINDLAFAIRRADNRIVDIGVPGRPLQQVVIFRPSPIEERSPLILSVGRDIELAPDQRLILEGSPEESIILSIPR